VDLADQVWMLPCFKHPFGKEMVSFNQRVEMCSLLAQPLGDKVRVCQVEKELDGVSYTVDTIEYLLKQYPHFQFNLVIGTDILAETEKWKDFDRIRNMVKVVEVNRGGEDSQKFSAGPIFPRVSSTDIREMFARQDQSVSLFLPARVGDYIRRNHLYLKGWGKREE